MQPTRLKAKTLIDNIMMNSLEYSSKSGNILVELSDHLAQILVLQAYTKDKKVPEINMFKRDSSSFNEIKFEELTVESSNEVYWGKIAPRGE